jgi:hypothetical protein
MITVILSKDGMACPDAEAEKKAMLLFNTIKNKEVAISTEVLFSAFRVAIKEGKIPHNEICFKNSKGEDIVVNKDGRTNDWEKLKDDGFHVYENLLAKLIDWA